MNPIKIFMLVFCVFCVSFITYMGYREYTWKIVRHAQEGMRIEWFKEHQCHHVYYVATRYQPVRVYKCNNGMEYTWDDIPAEPVRKP